MKQKRPRCGTCKYCDREAYRGTKAIVCYQLSQSPWGSKVATAIKEDQDACNRYVEGSQR